jgi:ABC-type Na+ transport system ATPase subunit NatA
VEILEGHRRRSGGSVRVLGFDPGAGDRHFRERVGIVLQSGGMDAELTVREMVSLFARFYARPRDAAETIEQVGLAAKRRARVRTLSGGQARRLDLALALIGDPEVLFLDEPTTGFDPNARREAWDMIAGLRRSGTTVLLTSHYLDEVQHLADRVGVMSHGHLAEESTPDALGGRDVSGTVISFRLPARLRGSEPPAGPWDRHSARCCRWRSSRMCSSPSATRPPAWLHDLASAFPVAPVAQAMEDSFNPATQSWPMPLSGLLVVLGWSAAAIVVIALAFRWEPGPAPAARGLGRSPGWLSRWRHRP